MKKCRVCSGNGRLRQAGITAVTGILVCLLAGCGGKTKKEYYHALSFTSESKLIGTWDNAFVRVEFSSESEMDEPAVFELNANNWEQEMNMKPVRMFFRADRTYRMEYRALNDSLTRVQEGHWEITGDSLFIEQLRPEWASFAYGLELDHRKARLTGLVDWDGDGSREMVSYGLDRKTN